MIEGRVRAIEQVGTNIWLGGRISQVKTHAGAVLGNVGNLAVVDSRTNRFKRIAPELGGADAEVWDIRRTGGRGTCLSLASSTGLPVRGRTSSWSTALLVR